MSILVINAGSSSLKFGLFDDDARNEKAHGMIDWSLGYNGADLTLQTDHGSRISSRLDSYGVEHAVARLLDALRENGMITSEGPESVMCTAHRIVHGGTRFRESVRIDSEVISAISNLADLAPLHNPPGLEGIRAVQKHLPDMPHVAVFDTSFHSRMPPSSFIYPLPFEWYENWGVRRFGFHGISHAYCAGRAAEMMNRSTGDLRLVICHLGNGCSATAVRGGISIFNTMGYTPIDGLMMGTRSGAVDPGILTFVQQRHGITASELEDVLNHRSGLAGVSGISGDVRQVEAAAQKGNERARLAIEIYATRIKGTVASLAARLGGIDALVFTAGVGENSARMRASVCDGLGFMGLSLDNRLNDICEPDADIAEAVAKARILVIFTREEMMIAREAHRILG